MIRKPRRAVLAATSVALVTLVALEVVVRVSGYSQHQIYDPIYMPFDRSRDIPYVHKPDLVQARARGRAVIDTDSLGLRTTSAGAPPGPGRQDEYRIAVVGDSVTFGEGVPRTEDTFAKVLEDTLNRQQRDVTVRVFNYAASAYSVREMAATLEHRMPEVRPDLVVMAIIPSDLNLGRTPAVDASGYLIDQTLSRFSPSSPVAQRLLRGIHLTYVVRDIGLLWIFKRPDMAGALARGEIPDSYRYVQAFRDTADRHGVPHLIALLPRMQGSPWVALPDRLARDRIAHVDLSALGREFTVEQYMASRFDPHPSPAVHRRIGEALAAHVLRRDVGTFPVKAKPP